MYPAWAPDGSRLAYSLDGQGLIVINADGSGSRKVSDHTSWGLAWSPDGSRLLVSDEGALIAVHVDGSREETLAQGIQPAWSR